jgi:hypothetical protein
VDIEIGQLRQQSRRLAEAVRDVEGVKVSTPSGTQVYGAASLASAVALFVSAADAKTADARSEVECWEDGLRTSANDFERTESEALDTFSALWRRAGW